MDRNEWIKAKYPGCRLSLSARRAWIEISGGACARRLALSSLSARRAWIEILIILYAFIGVLVALRKESVDRNSFGLSCIDSVSNVALRKESVDRNLNRRFRAIHNAEVALRKESVDRNSCWLLA